MRSVRRAVLLLCAALLVAAAPAAQAVKVDYGRNRSISIKLDSVSLAADLTGTVFSLYRIGDVENKGDGIRYVTSGQFAHTSLGSSLEYSTSDEVKRAAEYLVGYVRNHGISPSYVVSASKDGAALFQNPDVGVYLGRASGGPWGLIVTPFIVSVPRFTRESGREELQYAVAVVPKAEMLPPTPTPSPTPYCPPYNPRPPKLPQTGVLLWPIIAVGSGGLLFILLGAWALAVARKRRSDP